MSYSSQSLVAGFAICGLLIHVWALYYVYRKLRQTVPGWFKRGTKEAPRIYVTGRLAPGAVEMRAPLSGRPCAAWRLSVATVHPVFGWTMRTYDRYSEASFSIICDDGPLPVVLHSTTDRLTTASHVFDLVPAWLLPPVDPKHERAYTISVLGGWLTLPDHPRFSNAQADATRALAMAEVRESNLVSNDPTAVLAVTETILDFEQVWVCEGPRRDVNGALMIASDEKDGIGLAANPVKFAPQAELWSVIRRVVLREFGVILALDAFILFMVIFAGLVVIFKD